MAVPTTRIEYDGESKRRTVHSEVSLNSLKENLPEIYCHLIKQAEAQREFLLANLPKNLKRKYEQHLNRLAA
jgi:hypothetical protein